MQNHTFNILIVEDATIVIQQLYLLLSNKSASYNIQTANSAEIGLQLVAQKFPDVFILDIKLPGMSGIDFMNRIKQEYPDSNSLIIFLTNMPHDTYKQACMKNGANYFLDKSKEFLMLPEIIDNFFFSEANNKVIPNSTISISSLCNTPI